ncbi:MAG: hypothetical protein QNJ94_01565 [Alphaproteobacteria bacterium]|nr:hypothetical protein [Alphaproteobacteria bacterium]
MIPKSFLAALAAVSVALLLVAGPAAAAENPLTGKRTAEQAKPAAEPGLLSAIGRAFVLYQQKVNREIARHMKAIRDGDSSTALLVGLLLAFAYGAIHTLGPGHGKFIVLSYFVGEDAQIRRGFFMGTQIAVFHVLSAIVVVILADFLLRRAFGGAPAEIPAVRMVSYGSIAVIGAYMFWRAVKRVRTGGAAHTAGCDHGHGKGEQSLLSLAVGTIPCTGALLILLYALANDMLLQGVLLVVAISAGMAVTMSVLGILSIVARRLVTARLGRESVTAGRLSIALNFVGATVVTLIGAGLFTATALHPV